MRPFIDGNVEALQLFIFFQVLYSLIESSFCFLAAKEEITLCYRHRPSRQTKMKLDFFAVQGEEKGPFFVYLLISIR